MRWHGVLTLVLVRACNRVELTLPPQCTGQLYHAYIVVPAPEAPVLPGVAKANATTLMGLWSCTSNSPAACKIQARELSKGPAPQLVRLPVAPDNVMQGISGPLYEIHAISITSGYNDGGCKVHLQDFHAVVCLEHPNMLSNTSCRKEDHVVPLWPVIRPFCQAGWCRDDYMLPGSYQLSSLSFSKQLLSSHIAATILPQHCSICNGLHVMAPSFGWKQQQWRYLRNPSAPACKQSTASLHQLESVVQRDMLALLPARQAEVPKRPLQASIKASKRKAAPVVPVSSTRWNTTTTFINSGMLDKGSHAVWRMVASVCDTIRASQVFARVIAAIPNSLKKSLTKLYSEALDLVAEGCTSVMKFVASYGLKLQALVVGMAHECTELYLHTLNGVMSWAHEYLQSYPVANEVWLVFRRLPFVGLYWSVLDFVYDRAGFQLETAVAIHLLLVSLCFPFLEAMVVSLDLLRSFMAKPHHSAPWCDWVAVPVGLFLTGCSIVVGTFDYVVSLMLYVPGYLWDVAKAVAVCACECCMGVLIFGAKQPQASQPSSENATASGRHGGSSSSSRQQDVAVATLVFQPREVKDVGDRLRYYLWLSLNFLLWSFAARFRQVWVPFRARFFTTTFLSFGLHGERGNYWVTSACLCIMSTAAAVGPPWSSNLLPFKNLMHGLHVTQARSGWWALLYVAYWTSPDVYGFYLALWCCVFFADDPNVSPWDLFWSMVPLPKQAKVKLMCKAAGAARKLAEFLVDMITCTLLGDGSTDHPRYLAGRLLGVLFATAIIWPAWESLALPGTVLTVSSFMPVAKALAVLFASCIVMPSLLHPPAASAQSGRLLYYNPGSAVPPGRSLYLAVSCCCRSTVPTVGL